MLILEAMRTAIEAERKYHLAAGHIDELLALLFRRKVFVVAIGAELAWHRELPAYLASHPPGKSPARKRSKP